MKSVTPTRIVAKFKSTAVEKPNVRTDQRHLADERDQCGGGEVLPERCGWTKTIIEAESEDFAILDIMCDCIYICVP